MKRLLSALLLVTVSAIAYGAGAKPAAAKGARTAVDEFKALTQQEMASCSAVAATIPRIPNEMEYVAAQEPLKTCLLAGHAKTRAAFPAALKQMENNPAASQLLKDFYSAWLASFDNVGHPPREPDAVFEKRSSERRAAYETLWKRFKKEAAKKK